MFDFTIRILYAVMSQPCIVFTILYVSCFLFHMSGITYHLSRVTCHLSRVTCHNFFFFFYKLLELVGGGFVINGVTPSRFFKLACSGSFLVIKKSKLMIIKFQRHRNGLEVPKMSNYGDWHKRCMSWR